MRQVIEEMAERRFAEFRLERMNTQQLDRGMVYRYAIAVGNGEYIHVMVKRTVQGSLSVESVKEQM